MPQVSKVQKFITSCLQDLPSINSVDIVKACDRNQELTKPFGSLGRLEDLAIWYSSWQGYQKKSIDSILIAIFAGNHGVAQRGVSAYPAKVTAQMVANFNNGGAAINQLADLLPATLKVVDLELDQPTKDFFEEPAMSEDECSQAFQVGFDLVSHEYDLVIPGEMGIGNSTSASALGYAIYGGSVSDWVGIGTGVSNKTLKHKQEVVEVAVNRHRDTCSTPLDVMQCLGGRELVAIMGSILSARMKKIPVVIDGFICTAPVAVLNAIDSRLIEHVIAGHESAEKGHKIYLNKLGLKPILNMNMRLGEATGAALAAQILRAAVACYGGMATFAEAQVSISS